MPLTRLAQPSLTRMYGPAVRRKRISSICRHSGLASMYPASDWSGCSGPSWMSARMRSNYRPGLERAIWVTRVRTPERPVLHLVSSSRRPRQENGTMSSLSPYQVQFLCSCCEPFLRPGLLSVQGAARRGCQGWPLLRPPAGLGLDGPEHGAKLRQVGMTLQLSARIRSCAPC